MDEGLDSPKPSSSQHAPISEVMKQTLAAKTKVQQYDHEKMHSKYGGILKQKTKANLMGHINNIFHFKNRQESDVDKVIITNYDYEGKKVRY